MISDTAVIDEGIARKVLQIVDAGLTYGKGKPEPGKMWLVLTEPPLP